MEITQQTSEITEKLNPFFNRYKSKKISKGELIDPGDSIIYLKSGLIKMYTISINGEDVILNIFKPGSFFPMLHLFNLRTQQYQYEAIEKSEVILAPTNEFETYLKSEPDIVWDLLNRVYRGMDGLLQKMAQLMHGDAYKKTAIQLLLLGKRFGKEEEHGIKIAIPLTHVEIGSHAGISRETVTRMLKKLEEDKLISYKRNEIIIENLEELEHVISG